MIETSVDERCVATVTVNNPEQRNALGNAGKRELAEAIEHVRTRRTQALVDIHVAP